MSTITAPSKFIVITKDNKSVLFLRKDVSEYQSLIASIKSYFSTAGHPKIVIQTRDLSVCAGNYVDIPPGLWSMVITEIDNVRVTTGHTGFNYVSDPLVAKHSHKVSTFFPSKLSADTTNTTATPTSPTIETPTSTTDVPKPRFIIAFMGTKRVFLQWPDVADYDALFVTLNQQFPNINLNYKDDYSIQTNDLDICGGI
ncbi:hypothetical protein EDD18DRAFT_1465151 [Armillaria luteobubalina]|uniref:Uncharacterized protein n=1 Tax=Armillaria luteobubalina TaxID=153913 RepID=A0AA39TKI3_9AGAR|nr:hypothetical protein EDD18DRAFT_1465151 [Armillaria luteobubalina]